jgi:hypothetical protein
VSAFQPGDKIRASFRRKGFVAKNRKATTDIEGIVIGVGVNEEGEDIVIAHWTSNAVPGAKFRMGMVLSKVQKVTDES